MADNGSSVDPPQWLSGRDEIPEEDLQTLCRLYQKCPQLWPNFRTIVNFLDLQTTSPQAYERLSFFLREVMMITQALSSRESMRKDFLSFVVSSGFVEKSVDLIRQILRAMGKAYLTEYPSPAQSRTTDIMACLYFARCHVLNFTCDSSDFCVRLIKTGYIQDIIEDLKHTKHLTAEALEEGNVFLSAMGTIHNCCRRPEALVLIKQMDLVPHIVPFIEKRSKTQLVRGIALGTTAHIVDEDQLDLIRLDADILQWFLNNIKSAISQHIFSQAKWLIVEIICDFALYARNDFNKRLMVAQGVLGTLTSLLDASNERPEGEKHHAVTLLNRLIEDPINLQVCRNDSKLLAALHAFQPSEQIAAEVNSILVRLREHRHKGGDSLSDSPHLAELLAGQGNLLGILDMGQVEFVMDKFTALNSRPVSGNDASRVKVLLALTELVKDEAFQREVMSRGGLEALKKVLRRGNIEEQAEAANVIVGLVKYEENRLIVKNDDALMDKLDQLKWRSGHKELVQPAEDILWSLSQSLQPERSS